MFLVERNYAERMEMSAEQEARNVEFQEVHDLTWLTSFLSADKKKTYCLYEAADIDLVRKHAAELGLPADVIVEVSEIPA